jgi:hypothetical protein
MHIFLVPKMYQIPEIAAFNQKEGLGDGNQFFKPWLCSSMM